MRNESRTDKAVRNIIISLFMQVSALLVNFVCRTVFTKTMGTEYLGISGLFTNILTILSFAELGIGNAIVFRLYAPLLRGDRDKILQYLNLYKIVYRIIIIVVTVIGVALIPFLKYLVTAPNVKESLTLLYCLYLANTVLSYSFIYKKSLLIADQRDYIVSIITQVVTLVVTILQCVFLVLTHNFVIYCLLTCLTTLLGNIFCSVYANKQYAYLKNIAGNKLDKNEVRGLFSDVKGLLMTKIASVAFSGTDNIFISAYIGIGYVGILSNYTLILTMINNIMNKVFSSITASIGNLVADGDLKQTEKVLHRMYFVNISMYGLMCVGMILLLQEFVTKIWLNNSFYLPISVVVLAVVELFFRSIHFPLHTVQNALGLFSQFKIVSVIAAIANIVLDFILVKPLGIAGLYIATIICRGTIYLVDIFVVYHFGLKTSSSLYFITMIKWFLFLIVNMGISFIIIQRIVIGGILGFIIKVLIVTSIYVVLYIAVYRKNENFKYLLSIIQSKLLRKGKS